MDNYKIKVKDEAESKEAQELFFELGFRWEWIEEKEVLRDPIPYLFTQGKNIRYGLSLTDFEKCVGKKLTLPQLRDLVLLKRNDVNDATHVDPGGTKHIELDGRWYWFHEESTPDIQFGWVESASYREYDDKVLKPITQPQDPALISGADAMIAWFFEGKEVQLKFKEDKLWDIFELADDCYVLEVFKDPRYIFRLKPQTIKLELELPKPFEPKEGEKYYYLKAGNSWGFGGGEWGDDSMQEKFIQFGACPTETEVKQVVEQLRKIRGAS